MIHRWEVSWVSNVLAWLQFEPDFAPLSTLRLELQGA